MLETATFLPCTSTIVGHPSVELVFVQNRAMDVPNIVEFNLVATKRGECIARRGDLSNLVDFKMAQHEREAAMVEDGFQNQRCFGCWCR